MADSMSQDPPQQSNSLRNRIISACVGSVGTSLAVNPFDVVRVRMQQSSAVEHMQPPEAALTATVRPIETTVNEELLRTSSKELKLYKLPSGLTVALNPAFDAAGFNPKQLGINACCRDVFWFPSSIGYCIAEDTDPCAVAKAAKKGSAELNNSSTFGMLRKIMKDEGPLVPWRGVSLLLLQAIPANVIYYISYERVRDEIDPYMGPQLSPLTAGGIARVLASTLVSPLELLKTRLQSLYVSPGQSAMAVALGSIRELVAIDGYRSLWSGLGLTLWRDVPFSSIYWLVVEAVRQKFPNTGQSNAEKFAESIAAGTTGGVIASIVTTPFDVAKTRRQLGHASCTSSHMSMIQFMSTIAKNEGWKALFVGWVPRTMKIAPACAIMITSYEMGKRLLN